MTTTSLPATTFNRPTAEAAIARLKEALGGVDIGFELNVGRCSFSSNEITVQLKISDPGASPDRAILAHMCKRFGFDPDADLRSSSLGAYKLEGYHSRRIKYPWTVKTSDGKLYKLTHEQVEDAYARARRH